MSLPLLATPPPSDRVRMSSSAEIMTTFFMCRMGRIVYSSVSLLALASGLSHCVGSCGFPSCRTSKYRRGPCSEPVSPTVPMICPCFTSSPSVTRMSAACA